MAEGLAALRSLAPGGGRPLDAAAVDELYDAGARPWLRANMASTVDGAVELEGRSAGIGGASDRALFLHLRAMADVVVVGAGTVRSEGYGPVRVDGGTAARRRARGQAADVPIAVVTASASLDPAARLFTGPGPRPIVCTTAAAAVGALAGVADIEVCGADRVEPAAVVAALHRRGLTALHCEGGPTLLGSLLAAGLVDELDVTFGPLLAGPGRQPMLAGDPLATPVRTELAALLADGSGTLCARYLLHR